MFADGEKGHTQFMWLHQIQQIISNEVYLIQPKYLMWYLISNEVYLI
jgi:hypothetical protein